MQVDRATGGHAELLEDGFATALLILLSQHFQQRSTLTRRQALSTMGNATPHWWVCSTSTRSELHLPRLRHRRCPPVRMRPPTGCFSRFLRLGGPTISCTTEPTTTFDRPQSQNRSMHPILFLVCVCVCDWGSAGARRSCTGGAAMNSEPQ